MSKMQQAFSEADLQAVSDWIVQESLGDIDLQTMFDGFCKRLAGLGIPLVRVNLGFSTLHPMFRAQSMLWEACTGTSQTDIPYGYENSDEWRLNPIRMLVEDGRDELRYNMEQPGAWQEFPLLNELQAEGVTDYLALRLLFNSSDAVESSADGLLGSWSTTRAGGFTDYEVAALRRLHHRFGLTAKIAKREQTTLNILSAYLGGDAAKRVLAGQIRRGDGDVIPSVIWFSDMRRSTSLAESLSREDFLATLNTYFECTAGAVLAGGGDVLRFIGDAVLAIFPIGEDQYTTEEACRRALEAAADAQARMAAANEERATSGAPELGFGLGLHVGEVLFGNIGVPERVEFSVIGPAANEVARIEDMTKTLGRTVLLSEDFARHVDSALTDLGEHEFRGVREPKRLFAP
jgi:adenylate cyclase